MKSSSSGENARPVMLANWGKTTVGVAAPVVGSI